LTIDLKKIIRSRKPEKHQAQLTVRSDTGLIRASDIAGTGRQVFVPDTNIYIMNAAGTLPPAATIIVDQGLMFHCVVCLAELSVGVGNFAPMAAEWQTVANHYVDMFASIPANRLLVPDAQTWADAGMVAGVLARTQDFQKQQLKELLNDALVYLCAAKHGLPVLTNNKADFDLLQKIAPGGSFIFV
jgi:predicted nucleic acid-binding protein